MVHATPSIDEVPASFRNAGLFESTVWPVVAPASRGRVRAAYPVMSVRGCAVCGGEAIYGTNVPSSGCKIMINVKRVQDDD
jgi:hypothetical protein